MKRRLVIVFVALLACIAMSAAFAFAGEGNTETGAEQHIFKYKFTNLDDSLVQQYGFEVSIPQNGSTETGYIISDDGNGNYFRLYIEGYYGKYTSSGFDESQALYKLVPELEIKDIIINGKSYGSFMDAEDEEPCEIAVEGVTDSDNTWSDYPVSVTRWGDSFEFEFNNVLSTTDIDVEVVFAGKAHEHALTPTAAKDATCTEAGNSAYWTCSDCGAVFSDEAGTTEINQADTVIPAKGHNPIKVKATLATNTKDGNIAYYKCTNGCGKFFSDKNGKNEIAKAKVVVKAAKMTVKVKKPTAKAKKNTVIKKAKAFTVKNAKGKLTFKKVKGNKKITVAKNGKVTVKKGLKKNKTYSVKVKVTSAKTAKYAAITKTVTLKIKIK